MPCSYLFEWILLKRWNASCWDTSLQLAGSWHKRSKAWLRGVIDGWAAPAKPRLPAFRGCLKETTHPVRFLLKQRLVGKQVNVQVQIDRGVVSMRSNKQCHKGMESFAIKKYVTFLRFFVFTCFTSVCVINCILKNAGSSLHGLLWSVVTSNHVFLTSVYYCWSSGALQHRNHRSKTHQWPAALPVRQRLSGLSLHLRRH